MPPHGWLMSPTVKMMVWRCVHHLPGMVLLPYQTADPVTAGYGTNWIMVNDPTFTAFYDQALAASTIEQQEAINKAANDR